VSYLVGDITYWLRFFITSIPLTMLLLGACFARGAGRPRDLGAGPELRVAPASGDVAYPGTARGPRRRALVGVASATLAFLLAAPMIPTTVAAIKNHRTGNLEWGVLGMIFDHPLTGTDLGTKDLWSTVQGLADYITRMHLADHQIILDTFPQCAPNLVLQASDPKVFVITNDRDFQRVLADPLAFHTHYILTPDPTGLNGLGAISRLYPTLYATGDGFSRLVHQFSGGHACPTYRLYRVVSTAPDA